MSRQFWLVKSEPASYSWTTLVKDGRVSWTGVRNFQARNHLRAMQAGDLVLFYHSVTDKQVVGIARVTKTACPDPTATEGDWSCVELESAKPLAVPVHLDQIKADPLLRDMPLLKNSRLSVSPVTGAQFRRILGMGKTKI
jgi:predicted RNA-binding protein with PUA-like domain